MLQHRFFPVVFLLLLVQLFNCIPAKATHIVGGELNYRYLGNNIYEINLTVYRDCYNGVPPFDNPASVGIFNAQTNNFIREKLFNFVQLDTVPPTINSPCFLPPTDICYERTVYTDTVILPPSAGGYILSYQRCCRNVTIVNIITPESTGATYEAWMAGTSTFSQNSNPVFTNWPPPFVCAGYPFVFDHSATDYEGDSIVYQLISPLDGASTSDPMPQPPYQPPYVPVLFNPPYSVADMIGGVPPMSIDPNTGILTCLPTTLGQFVVGIRAIEYRGGVVVGYTRRDFQLNVVPCPTLVVAALQNPLISCGSNTVTFQNLSFNAGSYSWDFGVPGTTTDVSTATTPVFTYPDTGVYTVTLIAYSNIDPGCADTTVGTVSILPDYVADFTYTLDTCNNEVTFNDTSNTISGTTIAASWTFGDGATSNQQNPVHLYSSPGTWNAQLIATSSKGCKDTIVKPVVLLPNLDIQVQSSSDVSCLGDCNGTAQTTSVNGLPPYTYQWNDPALQTTALADSLCPGVYTVTVTDDRGCTSTETITISEPAALTATAISTPDYCGGICGGSASVAATGGTVQYSYQWSDPQQQQTSTATGLCQGTYTVTVTDSRGCIYIDSIQVAYVDSFPTLNATADTTVLYAGQSTSIHANTVTNNWNISWTPPSGLNNSNSFDPIATPPVTTTYVVNGTDQNGCPATDSVTIEVKDVLCTEPEIFIPNAFSPNNDQSNDILYVRGNTIAKVYLAIYDRWGELLFETNSTSLGWDGTYKGKPVTPDVYVYYVEITCYDKSEFRKKGNISVIR